MFGPGFFNNSGRNLRLIGIFGLLVVALAYHNAGGTSASARFVRIAGFGVVALAIAASGKRSPRLGQSGPGGARGAGGQNPYFAPSAGSNQSNDPAQPGWYPQPGSAGVQRYWNGAGWGQRRRWDGSKWLLE